MTTIIETHTRVDRSRLRARFKGYELGLLTLALTGELLEGLDHFVWLNSFAHNPHVSRTSVDVSVRRGAANNMTANTFIERISYNSPLEVLLIVSSAASGGLLIANRMIDTYNRFNQARVGKAKADAQALAYRILKEDIAEGLQNNDLLSQQSMVEKLERAAKSMDALERLDFTQEESV